MVIDAPYPINFQCSDVNFMFNVSMIKQMRKCSSSSVTLKW
ncbi:hypothetical protein SAMN04489707_107117 [Paenacidovorax caeni]|uniref:Uncharacterized protein n=1 Tax=Paenacidovorax caeni TaxID=343013 RepID=A0A1I7KTQ4_9BURK|nr:hypothetical protein SAMN04489707_107117 [Paenacidovorax caeni]